jgi:hypothetical protein
MTGMRVEYANQLAPSPVPAVTNQAAVSICLAVLEDEIGALDKTLTNLVDRLGPILRPTSDAGAPCPPRNLPDSRCQIADFISTQLNRLVALRGGMESILARVDC